MAFIATPAFSNLYSSGLLTTASLPSNSSATILDTSGADSAFLTGQTLPFNPYEVVLSSGQMHHQHHQSVVEAISLNQTDKKPILDPFDPAAVVPLPSQLEDQFGPFTTSVWKRNERERFRVRCVNDGYQKLRRHLPVAEDEKRLSKVDTLRLAIRYIRHLSEIVRNEMHLHHCRCFENFTEQSEGHVQIYLAANGRRI
ncbi:unnamed protein product, partial [Mesorhabditis spiculigera]